MCVFASYSFNCGVVHQRFGMRTRVLNEVLFDRNYWHWCHSYILRSHPLQLLRYWNRNRGDLTDLCLLLLDGIWFLRCEKGEWQGKLNQCKDDIFVTNKNHFKINNIYEKKKLAAAAYFSTESKSLGPIRKSGKDEK